MILFLFQAIWPALAIEMPMPAVCARQDADGALKLTYFFRSGMRPGESFAAFSGRTLKKLGVTRSDCSWVPLASIPNERSQRAKWRLRAGKVIIDRSIVTKEEMIASMEADLDGIISRQDANSADAIRLMRKIDKLRRNK